MSDDQMRGLKDLLRTESNDPPDVTEPMPRPPGRARGLSALTEASPAPAAQPTEVPAEEPTEPAAVSTAARPRVTRANRASTEVLDGHRTLDADRPVDGAAA